MALERVCSWAIGHKGPYDMDEETGSNNAMPKLRQGQDMCQRSSQPSANTPKEWRKGSLLLSLL